MFRSKKYILLASSGAFLLFIFFSYLVHKNIFTHFDFNNTVRLQDHISRNFDSAFSLLSDIGRVEVVGLFLLILLFIYRKLKSFIILLFFGAFHLFELYGKTFVIHTPPPHFMLRTEQLFNFPTYYVSTVNSYPSGHAARALFITTILFFLAYKTKKLSQTQKLFIYVFLVIYDITMLISRVYLGEHWTSDVIGGSILGLSFGVLSLIFL